jgi:NADH dehydrogenase FAD-containing subunit
MKKNRVLILGGGFGGLYAALEFEKRRDPDFEVTLISQKNFFLFTPMLHEVAASNSSRKFRPLTTQLSQRSPSRGSTARTRQNGNP